MDNFISRRHFLGVLGCCLAVPTVLASCSTTKREDQAKQKLKLAELRATKKYKEKKIEVGDNFYSPKETTIEAGTIVIWTNTGRVIHDVMADDPDGTSENHDMDSMKETDFTSATLQSGDIYVRLFTKPGKHFYHCHFHGGPQRGQWGSITVSSTDRTL